MYLKNPIVFHNGSHYEDKEAKSTKKCVIKEKLKFENYKNCHESFQLENKINHVQKIKLI